MPRADPKLIEDGYGTAVERAGHGVQRAFILTALQHLAVAQMPLAHEQDATTQPDDVPTIADDAGVHQERPVTALPSFVLGIEEPELYQHPSRQRHLSQVLLQLAMGGIKGVAQSTQVIYATHSPLFVDLQRFHQIRMFRKEAVPEDGPKQARISQATLADVTHIIETANDVARGTYSPDAQLARLYTLMTPWTNEGFFADVVVLVEGEEDHAAIIGTAAAMGHQLDSLGIAVIPCMGKTNLHKAVAVFRSFGTPIYVIWDSDHGDRNKRPEDNHRLLRCFGSPIEDHPSMITNDFACFKVDLYTTLRYEITHTLFDRLLAECASELAYDETERARKNPLAIQFVIEEASKQGRESTSLKEIVKRVLAKRSQASAS